MSDIQYLYNCVFCQSKLSYPITISSIENDKLYIPYQAMIIHRLQCYGQCQNVSYKHTAINFNNYLHDISFEKISNDIRYEVVLSRDQWTIYLVPKELNGHPINKIILSGTTNNFQPVITPNNFQEKVSKLLLFI